ncbi:MAG: hypothetical protein D6675_09765 [Gemmatimonadetes bacterium]|nr:MAG: hypothetical protein D6675_09765 [Gemmatimonadota bacterium]
MKWLPLVVVALLTLFVFRGEAGTLGQKLEVLTALSTHGFQNVDAVFEGDTVIVFYENRGYRTETQAMNVVITLLDSILSPTMDAVLVVHHQSLPVLVAEIPRPLRLGTQPVGGVSFSTGALTSSLSGAVLRNRSQFKFSLVQGFSYHAILGNFEDAWKPQLNWIPELQFSPWHGGLITGAVYVRLWNEMKDEGYREHANNWKLGWLVFNQLWRFPNTVFVSTTIGQFDGDRYGGELQAKGYFHADQLALEGHLGYVSYSQWADRHWTYNDLSAGDVVGSLAVEYRYLLYDLTLRVQYATYLYGDRGWEFSMNREFGDLQIGFFGLNTEAGINAGFRVLVPLLPTRYMNPNHLFQVRPADAIRYEYRGRTFVRGAQSYRNPVNISDWLMYYHPGLWN